MSLEPHFIPAGNKPSGCRGGQSPRSLTQDEAREIRNLPDILKEDGYPDVQAFMAIYRESESVVEQYNRSLAEWERQAKEKRRPPRDFCGVYINRKRYGTWWK